MNVAPLEAPPVDGGAGEGREWPRALALALFLITASVVDPFPLVAIPFLLLVLALPVRRTGVLILGMAVAALVVARPAASGLWYMERGWSLVAGGWFVGLTLAWPASRLAHRALGAVAGAAVVSGAAFIARPEWWAILDWQVRERMLGSLSQLLALLRDLRQGGGITSEVEASLLRTADLQAGVFPAVMALGTAAALALAWWIYSRLAVGRRGALAPVRDFGFEDQLVWVFIAGLLLVVMASGEGWTRTGSNTLVFMGALYALRGAGVILFLSGGITFLGGVMAALALLFMAPVVLLAAMLIGLSDTWLDVRTRVRTLMS